MDHSIHLPSAGMIRFRFNGFTDFSASQPQSEAPRGEKDHSAQRRGCKGESAWGGAAPLFGLRQIHPPGYFWTEKEKPGATVTI